MKKDLFISHASEDKDDFVRPLANLLREYGVEVWYDEFELKIGSSLSGSIDKGIANSRFGLLVLSKSFFNKNWTGYELKSLNAFEVETNNVILPIWKDVTKKDVRKFSPYLADKIALNANLTIEEIAIKIIEVVRPDIFSELHKKLLIQNAIAENKILETTDYSMFKYSPIRHPKLNENLISRIRLIRSSLWLCYPHSMHYWMDGFQRDLHIESEIRYWEHISTCFLEAILQHNPSDYYTGESEDMYGDLFNLILNLSNPNGLSFKAEFIDILKEIVSHNIPIYDIEEVSPFGKTTD